MSLEEVTRLKGKFPLDFKPDMVLNIKQIFYYEGHKYQL